MFPPNNQSDATMRFDKLTTKFQQAIADAQSLAVKNDNPYIETLHVLAALLSDSDSSAGSLLARAGVGVYRLIPGVNDAIAALALDRKRAVEGNSVIGSCDFGVLRIMN